MKKLLAIPLMLLYMASVSGVIIQIHFCGQKLQSWSMPYAAETTGCCTNHCTTSQTVSKNACCQDKTLSLKITQDQIVSAFQFLVSDLQTAITGNAFGFATQWVATTTKGTPYQANAPPNGRWQNIPLFKLHQRFTFYG